MKKDTITITRAEYAQLNKAANAAVEHACELFQAARLVDELEASKEALEAENAALKARIAALEAERDAIQADGEELLEENKALTLEKADLIREKHAAESRAELAECFLLSLQTEIDVVSSSAMISGDYKGQMDYLAEVAKRFEL